MDAISKERWRDCNKKREKRWSMNSQRLEEIVAELMKPISDLRHSFDTDLSSLLEEYLTEVGLHALEEDEGEEGCGLVDAVRPNFSELALLVQHCASVYGRKVDFLYQQVLSVSESTHNASLELSSETTADCTTPSGSKRRRKSVGAATCWGDIRLEAAASGGVREARAVPPPTLPRLYAELQPRAVTQHDVQLADHAGEPIGLLADFHVTWRLQDGILTDDLECSGFGPCTLGRAVPLLELQAALAAAAPPALPTTPVPTTPLSLDHSTPIPTPTPPQVNTTQDTLMVKKGRKRRSDIKIDNLSGCTFKLHITKELLARLRTPVEFSVPGAWVRAVVAERARRLQEVRRLAQVAELKDQHGFRGFEYCAEVGGFAGWAMCERDSCAEATALQLHRLSEQSERRDTVSDDDGFFERSSLHSDDSPHTTLSSGEVSASWWESSEWLSRVVSAPVRTLDVREEAARVLAALPPPACAPPPPPPTPFKRLLATTAHQHSDVSRIFLATLFLANAGNVEVCAGAPGSVDSFAVRALSREPQLYAALAAAEPALAPPAPAPPIS